MPSTPALAHAPPTHQTHRAPTHTYALFHVFDSRATHARTLLPAALASVPFGFVLVRVRVRRQADASFGAQGSSAVREALEAMPQVCGIALGAFGEFSEPINLLIDGLAHEGALN